MTSGTSAFLLLKLVAIILRNPEEFFESSLEATFVELYFHDLYFHDLFCFQQMPEGKAKKT